MTKRFLSMLLALAIVLPAMAQFKFGPRVGINVNSLHFSEEILNSDNRAGFTAGLQFEFTVPIIGVGGDLSAMYVKRNTRWMEAQDLVDCDASYISIPLNFKYKLGLPGISQIITPYVFTGPDFAFRTSKKVVSDIMKQRNFDVAWNFGLGLEFIKHLQVSASYGLGLTKALETVQLKDQANKADIAGRNRYWTVTAAWLF